MWSAAASRRFYDLCHASSKAGEACLAQEKRGRAPALHIDLADLLELVASATALSFLILFPRFDVLIG